MNVKSLLGNYVAGVRNFIWSFNPVYIARYSFYSVGIYLYHGGNLGCCLYEGAKCRVGSGRLLLLTLGGIHRRIKRKAGAFHFLASRLKLLHSVRKVTSMVRFVPVRKRPCQLARKQIIFFHTKALQLHVGLHRMRFGTNSLLTMSPNAIFRFLCMSPSLSLTVLTFSGDLVRG